MRMRMRMGMRTRTRMGRWCGTVGRKAKGLKPVRVISCRNAKPNLCPKKKSLHKKRSVGPRRWPTYRVTLKANAQPPPGHHPLSIALAALSGKDDAPHALGASRHPPNLWFLTGWAELKRIWRRSIVARVLSKHSFLSRRLFHPPPPRLLFFPDGHVNTAGTSCAAKSRITFSRAASEHSAGLAKLPTLKTRLRRSIRLQPTQIFTPDAMPEGGSDCSLGSHSNVLLRSLVNAQMAGTKGTDNGRGIGNGDGAGAGDGDELLSSAWFMTHHSNTFMQMAAILWICSDSLCPSISKSHFCFSRI